MKKTITLLCAISAAALLGGCGLDAAQANAGAKTNTAKAAYGDLLLGLSSDGKIKLPVTNLNFEVGGTIKDVYVAAGDSVKKGALLAELDDSELRLALSTAQTNLNKAQASYDDAVANADYNLKTELASYQTNKQKLTSPFDDYTYQQSITAAETTVARREKELAEAQASLAEAQAKQPAASVALSVERKTADLKTAEDDLKAAEAALAKAKKEPAGVYDDYTNKNSIASAETAYARKMADYNEADAARLAAYNALQSADAASSEYESLSKALTEAEKKAVTAGQAAEDARVQLTAAKQALERAKAAFDESEQDKREANVEAAQKTVDNAAKSVETARRSLQDAQLSQDNAGTDITGGVTTAAKQLETAKTNLEDAKTSLASAKANLTRAAESYRKDLEATRQSVEMQELKLKNMEGNTTAITNALYAIEEAKLKVEEAENNIEKLRIYAPIDGTVLSVSAKAGEVTQARDNTPGFMMGTANSGLISIVDPTVVYLTASVTEGDIVGLSVGQTIRVSVDALGEENLSAKVYSISSIPSTDSSGIVTYEVVGVLDAPNPELRDNMSAFLTFVKKEKLNVLLAPNKSIFIEDNQQYVNVQKADGTYEKRAVMGGLSNGTQTEITDGLQAGETVAVGSVKS